MAASTSRILLLARKCTLSAIRKKAFLTPGVIGCQTHVANLTSVRSKPIQRMKPWPYEKWGYGFLTQFIDDTRKRFNDNTKVILVEGNIGVGKTEFAKKIAELFDMRYFPDIQMDDIFTIPWSGFDLRELDEQLPWNLQCFDLKDFLTIDPKQHPDKVLCLTKTQYRMYQERYRNYTNALAHLLNTGQGVVLDRSVFGEVAIVDALYKMGYFRKEGFKFLQELRKYSICELWKPHLVIYLDAPVSMVQEKIKKKNKPLEVSSPILNNEEFLKAIEDNYKGNFLPYMRKYAEVLSYDLTEMPDMDIVVEELEELDLVEPPMEEYDKDDRFNDWHHEQNFDLNGYRVDVTNADKFVVRYMGIPEPFECPELRIMGDDTDTYRKVVSEDSRVKYLKGYNPKITSIWRLMLKL
ncbi:hypothetical protein CHS0354_019712 [Potamilus streckersoni]|uniref:NADH dehydrogenase [ubiquinone] 1 alpha subcomplex subunit 10, mitochondrial n=1 Tax=Potamilus streckersoni TaxID=2493646 RepID=A0AAE0SA61_9BIVA|nr:hypothetical protein CHS0354_019712 [Potamilus streckersoni]